MEEYHERSKGSIARLAFWRGKLRTHYKTTRDVIDRNVFYEELNDAITYYLEPILKYLDWWKNKIEEISIADYDMGKCLVFCNICLSTFGLVSKESEG